MKILELTNYSSMRDIGATVFRHCSAVADIQAIQVYVSIVDGVELAVSCVLEKNMQPHTAAN